MGAGELQAGLVTAVVDAVFQALATQQADVVHFGRDDDGVRLGRGTQDGAHGLGGLLGVIDNGAAFFDDTGFFGGDLVQRITEDLGVVEADFCDGGHQLVGHDVGRIAAAAQAGLQHDKVALFAGEPEQCQRRDSFKLDRDLAALQFDGIDGVQHLLGQAGQGARRDHLAVDLEPLTEIHHVGADGQAGLVAGSGQDGRGHGGQAAFAVSARNVDALEVFFRVAQVIHQVLHAGQAGCPLPQARQSVQCFDCLLGGHASSSSSLLSSPWAARWAARRARRSCSR